MLVIPYGKAKYCPECDAIYSNSISDCPICCNKNGVSLNSIRNEIIKKLGNLEERRGEIRSSNYNQVLLF
jgi:hypothetical protein